MVKGIIFDFDGVITYPKVKIGRKIADDVANEKGLIMDFSKNDLPKGASFTDIIKRMFPEKGQEISDEFFKRYSIEYPKHSALYPGVKETLEYLKSKNIKLFIYSSKFESIIRSALEKLDILDLFDFIIGEETFEFSKPSEKGVNFLMEKFGLKKNELFYVGDMKNDQILAENSKLNFIFFNSFLDDEHGVTKYDFKINSFPELKKVIFKF